MPPRIQRPPKSKTNGSPTPSTSKKPKRPWRQKALETASTFTGVHWLFVSLVLTAVTFATTCGVCELVKAKQAGPSNMLLDFVGQALRLRPGRMRRDGEVRVTALQDGHARSGFSDREDIVDAIGSIERRWKWNTRTGSDRGIEGQCGDSTERATPKSAHISEDEVSEDIRARSIRIRPSTSSTKVNALKMQKACNGYPPKYVLVRNLW